MTDKGRMTPGPWRVDYNGTYGPWVNSAKSTDPDYGTAAHHLGHETHSICTPHGPNAKVNTRAIACLPELVEAARSLLGWVEAETDGRDWPHPQLEAMRRILARIDGEDA